jgi:hypothetical protein
MIGGTVGVGVAVVPPAGPWNTGIEVGVGVGVASSDIGAQASADTASSAMIVDRRTSNEGYFNESPPAGLWHIAYG